MQKVEGSSPFSRFRESPAQAGFFYGLVLSEQAGVVLITHGCGGPLEAAGLLWLPIRHTGAARVASALAGGDGVSRAHGLRSVARPGRARI